MPKNKQKLYIEIYSTYFTVFTNKDKFINYLKRKHQISKVSVDMIKASEAFYYLLEDDGNYDYLMYLPEIYSDTVTAHETIHLAWGILERVGIKVSFANHEALTYLQGVIMDLIKKKIYGRE